MSGLLAAGLIGSAGLGYLASTAGADVQKKAARDNALLAWRQSQLAKETRGKITEKTDAMTQPYEAGGAGAIQRMSERIRAGVTPDTQYNREIQESNQATARAAAAGGKLRSTQTAEDFANNATQAAGNLYKRYMGRVASGVNTGVTATNAMAQAGGGTISSMQSSLANQGQAMSGVNSMRAEGVASRYGAISQGLQSGINAAMFVGGM